ncbi:MAG: YibE/F family protein [Patescibacteria group bacterium]
MDRIYILGILFLVFALFAIFIGRKRGFFALIALVATVAILFGMIFPLILAGYDAVLVTIVGAVLILCVNFPLSHGWNKETLAGFLGALGGLLLVIVFSELSVWAVGLGGLGSDDVLDLLGRTDAIEPIKLLLAGIILGAVGFLDDVTMNQAEIVTELHDANPRMSHAKLFLHTMAVGRHRIASTINTLVLAYAGAALPLFLLFVLKDGSVMAFMNTEVIAEEIVRTLAGATALCLTVPLSTAFALMLQKH